MKTYPVYLDGELRVTEKTYVVTNPASGEAVANMSTVARREIAQAIEHAHTAFISWRQIPGKKRGEWLRQGRSFVWNATNLSRQLRRLPLELFAAYQARFNVPSEV